MKNKSIFLLFLDRKRKKKRKKARSSSDSSSEEYLGGAKAKKAKRNHADGNVSTPKWATLKRSDLLIERDRTLDALNHLEDYGNTDKVLLKTIGREIVRLNNVIEDAGRKLFSLKVPQKLKKDLKQTLNYCFQAADLSHSVLGVIDSAFYLNPDQAVQVALAGSRQLQNSAQKKVVAAFRSQGSSFSKPNFNQRGARGKPQGKVLCYHCGGTGHKANNCSTPKKSKPGTQS